MLRGRRACVERQQLVNAVLRYKDELLDCKRNAIVSECHSVWNDISKELLNKISFRSIYSYVTNNRYDLRNIVIGIPDANLRGNINDIATESVDGSDISDDEEKCFVFMMSFPKTEFDNLIVQTARRHKDKNGNFAMRIVNILQPNKWTELMAKKIYDDFRLSHGYHFKVNYVNNDRESGGFTGKI